MPGLRFSVKVVAWHVALAATFLGTGCSHNSEADFIPTVIISPDVLDGPARPSGIDLSSIDRSISPGDDFYSFANGRWLASASIPNEHDSYGFFTIASRNGIPNISAIA